MEVFGIGSEHRQLKARTLVLSYINEQREKTDTPLPLGLDNIFVVWYCKTLQNFKALVSTDLPDGMYYEVTYSGDVSATYLDVYQKVENVVIPD